MAKTDRSPQARWAKYSSLASLRRPLPWLLANVTSGRWGGLVLSPRRRGRCAGSAKNVGKDDGDHLDRYATATCGPSVGMIMQFADIFRADLRAEAARMFAKLESGIITARTRLGMIFLANTFLVAAVVLLVETLFNQPLASRIGPGGEAISYLVSIGLGIMVMLLAHTMVHSTPPGRRHVIRRRLRIAGIAGVALFFLSAGYVRKFSPMGDGDYATDPATASPTESFDLANLIGPLAIYTVMLGVMLVTFWIAGLATLRYEEQRDRLDADGPQFQKAHRRLKRFGDSINQLEAAADALAIQFRDAYWSGLHSTADPNIADRLMLPDHIPPTRGPGELPQLPEGAPE